MSGNKTEKPTAKKKKDAADKGQSFKSKDLVITCLILTGALGLANFSSASWITSQWQHAIADNFQAGLKEYALSLFIIYLKVFLPFLLLCIAGAVLPAMLQTGFKIATKVFKINFDSLNPVKGIKKIFSLRTAKDFIKSTLYFCCVLIAAYLFWNKNKALIFSLVWAEPRQLFPLWGALFSSLIYISLACMAIVIILDAIAEYFIHIRDLKMEKQEVKKEHKEQEGSPEIKSKRRELRMELLSEQDKTDIEKSKFIVANPTHIAVGVYINMDIVPIPFISLLETNQKALAVRAYAKKMGVPVVENIKLARKIYQKNKRYSFVSLEELDEIFRILVWLQQVEDVWKHEHAPSEMHEE